MSVHYDPDRRRFVVRWREDVRQRSKRLRLEEDAVAFGATMRGAPTREFIPSPPPKEAGRDGVYAYDTKAGARYRFVFRQSDGTLNSRGDSPLVTPRSSPRRKLTESIDRGEVRDARC